MLRPSAGTCAKRPERKNPRLATGCRMVLKPAEEAPLTPLRVAELCQEAGVPPGVVNVVPGYGETAGAALAAHPDVDKVAFTGSHLTGQKIVQASAGNLKRVSLELGGKSPDVVFADADLDAAVPGAGMAVFANSGQICSAGTRLFVERRIYDEFTARVAEYSKTLRVGDGSDPKTQVGPLARRDLLDTLERQVDDSVRAGARVLIGGERLAGKGYFFTPTVLGNVTHTMAAFREETFGPVAAVVRVRDADEAIRVANDSAYGLGAAIWTRDAALGERLARRIEAGSVFVNGMVASDPRLPFGGIKRSGYGRELAAFGAREFTNIQTIWIGPAEGQQPTSQPAE